MCEGSGGAFYGLGMAVVGIVGLIGVLVVAVAVERILGPFRAISPTQRFNRQGGELEPPFPHHRKPSSW